MQPAEITTYAAVANAVDSRLTLVFCRFGCALLGVNELGMHYHGIRYRTTGYIGRLSRSVCSFRIQRPVGEAHRLATVLVERLPVELDQPAEVITQPESLEDHEDVHSREHYTVKPG